MSLSDTEYGKVKKILEVTNTTINTQENLADLLDILQINDHEIKQRNIKLQNYVYPAVANIMIRVDVIASGSLEQQNELFPLVFKIIDAISEKTTEFESNKNSMPHHFDMLQILNREFAQRKTELQKKLNDENSRFASITKSTEALKKIKDKINSDKLHHSFLEKVPQFHDKTAKNAANALCSYFEKLIDAYKNKATYEEKECDLKQFKFIATYILGSEKEFNACTNQNQFPISESMKDQRENADLLKTHRSYEVLIKNLLLAIISIPFLGVPYGIGVAITGRLSVFAKNTDTGDKIVDLLNAIDNTNEGPTI